MSALVPGASGGSPRLPWPRRQFPRPRSLRQFFRQFGHPSVFEFVVQASLAVQVTGRSENALECGKDPFVIRQILEGLPQSPANLIMVACCKKGLREEKPIRP